MGEAVFELRVLISTLTPHRDPIHLTRNLYNITSKTFTKDVANTQSASPGYPSDLGN